MRSRPPSVPALAALLLAVAGSALSAAGIASAAAIVPAPPPASYCYAAPPGGWQPVLAAPALVPDLSPFQSYREDLGIPTDLTGAGIRIGDVEYEWAAKHVEFAGRDLPAANPSGLDPAYRARDHGTAVLGILGASDDHHGITGLAPRAGLVPVSPIVAGAQGGYQPVKAITAAADKLHAGDVLLIELQALVTRPDGTTLLGPIEYYDSVRAAISDAVDRGIVVVEPAGNGSLDVATLGPSWLASSDDPLASGALMVGAGGSGGGVPAVGDLERVPGSNFGARVDVQGLGAAVVTSGYADISSSGAGSDRSYTACFDGTSSASATVAGAVALLQQAAIARTGDPLDPWDLRDLIVDTGLPQILTPGDEGVRPESIGPRPQIDSALAALPSSPQAPPATDGQRVVTDPKTDGAPAAATPVPTATPTPAPFSIGSGSPASPGRASLPPAAARGLVTRFDRPAGRLVIRLRGAAAAAAVRLGGHRLALHRGRLVLTGVSPGSYVLRVSAAPAAGTTYRAVRFRVIVPVHGRVRVTRL